MTDTPTRVLPADVYDTLELVAYAYGGIGAVRLYDLSGGEPYCIYGAAGFATGTSGYESPVAEALRRAYIGIVTNDVAVAAINRRRGKPERARVPFRLWCKELNVVRGA